MSSPEPTEGSVAPESGTGTGTGTGESVDRTFVPFTQLLVAGAIAGAVALFAVLQ